jgi:hypothetical protein
MQQTKAYFYQFGEFSGLVPPLKAEWFGYSRSS